MTYEALRFLALNSVLHGYTAVEGFEGSLTTMANALEISEKEASLINNSIEELFGVEFTVDKLTQVFLNYYRTSPYAFIDLGSSTFYLRDLIEMDLDGQVDEQLRGIFLSKMFHDVSQGDMYLEPYILDGILYCTVDDFQNVDKAVTDAYHLYLSGPVGTPKMLSNALRKYTSMEEYSRLGASMLLKIFKQMIRYKHSPVVYQQTMLNTPDLLDVYRSTGCIMSFRSGSHSVIDWILDAEDVVGGTVAVTVEPSALKLYLVKGITDLAGTKALYRAGERGKILFSGVNSWQGVSSSMILSQQD